MQFLRTLIAIIAGLFIGSVVNMSIVKLGGFILPLPNNLDASKMEDLKAAIPYLDWIHFIFPFLAHALGTLSGSIIAVLFSKNHPIFSAYTIAIFFFAGGVTMNLFLLPSPIWFTVVDLVLAYIPMGILAIKWLKRG